MAEAPDPNPSYLVSNSHKARKEAEEKKEQLKPVVSGEVNAKKKPLGKKMQEAMLGDDIKEVKSYLLWDVFIPALKDTMVDLIKKGAEALFYGGARTGSNYIQRTGNTSRVSYAKYHNAAQPKPTYSYNKRAAFEFDDLVFQDRRDAEAVLANLVEQTMSYGMASVADFYELSGRDSDFTDNKYGWGELGEARVVRVRDGYILDLPKPEPID